MYNYLFSNNYWHFLHIPHIYQWTIRSSFIGYSFLYSQTGSCNWLISLLMCYIPWWCKDRWHFFLMFTWSHVLPLLPSWSTGQTQRLFDYTGRRALFSARTVYSERKFDFHVVLLRSRYLVRVFKVLCRIPRIRVCQFILNNEEGWLGGKGNKEMWSMCVFVQCNLLSPSHLIPKWFFYTTEPRSKIHNIKQISSWLNPPKRLVHETNSV